MELTDKQREIQENEIRRVFNYKNFDVKMNGFRQNYQLMEINYKPNLRKFVTDTNEVILDYINNAYVSKENYKNYLVNIIKSTLLEVLMVQQKLSDLSDKEDVTLLQMVEDSIEKESNPLKRKKLKVLKEFLDHQLGLSDTEEPPGSDSEYSL
jgi:hypothetical protein